jgi:arsenite methyltransferase
MTTATSINTAELEAKVKAMYQAVAENPGGSYHFELGRRLAEHLGYPPTILDEIPAGAVKSFAGVGYFFDLAELDTGESVVDLGSGSGMDVFFAAMDIGPSGLVTGIDMTPEQLTKADALRLAFGFTQVTFIDGHIDDVPLPDASADVVISNGVINLAADKRRVFAEAARVLRPGGRLAIADIVTDLALPAQVVANTDLWASCIGGATQFDAYQQAIEAAGLRLESMKRNDYRFLSEQAVGASERFGVRSVSLLARKQRPPDGSVNRRQQRPAPSVRTAAVRPSRTVAAATSEQTQVARSHTA